MHLPPNFSNQNDFSFWFPKIENCGMRVPKSLIFKVPSELLEAFYMERKGDFELIRDWAEANIIPQMENSRYFMKNSRFSNKFDFKHCITDKRSLVNDLCAIQYASLCLETNGEHEVVLREIIGWEAALVPGIYSGMPLRTELRVFYDFEQQKVLYTANYWDYDYVRPHLYDKTDQIIFDAWREKIEQGFVKYKTYVEKLVESCMRNVEGLEKQWSIDILVDERPHAKPIAPPEGLGLTLIEDGQEQPKVEFWLIDMALAQASAYWDAEKAGL